MGDRRLGLGGLGGWVALGVSAMMVARVVGIGEPGALVVVAPAIAGGLIGVRATARPALGAASLLLAVTATLGLIAWWGLAYVPTATLIALAATRPSPAQNA